LVNADQIDVVLSDIMMPGGVNGLQLARDIRNRHPRLPIILTTGYVEAAADLKDGEFHLLPKPFSLESLADALGVEVK
jgi:CheY-like chemotaxis protein